MTVTRILQHLQPLHAPEGDGGGGGGFGGGDGAGGAPPSQGGGLPSGGGAPISLSDDTLVQFDGMDKAMPWKDVRSTRFVPREEHDNFAKNFQSNFRQGLQQLAKTIQQQRGRGGQPGGQPGTAQPRQDLFAGVRNKPLVSGQDIASLAEQIRNGDIEPLRQHAAAVNDTFAQMKAMIDENRQVTGGLAERHSTQEYQSRLTSAIGAMGEDYDPQDPTLRTIAEDIYLSHDPTDTSLNTEFPRLMKDRINSMVKYVRALDAKKLERAKSDRKRFLRPGGTGQPGASGRATLEPTADIASRLFATPTIT